MALVYQNLTLEVTPGMIPPVLHVTEYDVNMQIDVTFTQHGQPYEIPSGTTAKVEGTLAGHPFRENCTVNGNVVTFILSENMTAYAGRAWTKIKLTKDSKPVSTCGFWLDCDRAGVEAETVIGAPGFEEQIREAVADYLDESDFVIDPTLTISGAAADAKVAGDKATELKSVISLSQNITPESSLTPNPKTVNGVTITVLGPGKLHLSGTATGSVAIDHYISNSDLPPDMEYGESYYATVIGGTNSTTRVFSYGTTMSELCTVTATWGKFTAPRSGGLAIRTSISSGLTYDETVEVVIIKDNVYTQSIANFEDLSANLAQTNILLAESNLPINYAVASTATKTHNGLTFSADNGVITVNGTSTGVAFYDLFRLLRNPEEFPLKAGHTYALRFADETLSPLIYKQIAYAETSSSGETTLYSKQWLSDYIVFTVPDTLYDFYVRLVCGGSGVTYTNKAISFAIEEVTDKKDVIVVDADGGGDFTSLKAGIEYAMLKYGTRVIVKKGTYNLVSEFGKSYLDSLSGDDYGIMLGNGIEIIFAPNAYVSFDYDGTNDWVIANFSPFNTANDLGYTIDGLHCTAHNCRYILHDDPRPGVKGRYSKNVIRNCYFELFPSTEYSSWVNHQIIGGGLGDSTMVEIENCIFNDHFSGVSSYSCVSYHNSTSGNANYESRIVVKDCYFADGNTVAFEGYGDATSKTKIIVCGNNLSNGDNDVVYRSTSADNMTIYKWNNYPRN